MVKLDETYPVPPTAYLPHRFLNTRNYGVIVRGRAQPAAVVPDVRAAVRAVDPSLALHYVYTMDEIRWLSYWMYVMWGTMFGVFALIALAIAAIGVYGVVFYTVSLRTREIGVRVALGAVRGQVVGPMLRQIALYSIAGLALGLGGALLLTPVVGSLLLDLSPHDPAGLVGVCVLLFTTAVAATWLPAWRASGVDPVKALREH
jgi:putative ABC transport system permease protein